VTDAELDAIEASAKAATPGPWTVFDGDVCLGDLEKSKGGDELIGTENPEDARYIAAMHPQTAFRLVAEVRRLRAALVAIRDDLHLSAEGLQNLAHDALT